MYIEITSAEPDYPSIGMKYLYGSTMDEATAFLDNMMGGVWDDTMTVLTLGIAVHTILPEL